MSSNLTKLRDRDCAADVQESRAVCELAKESSNGGAVKSTRHTNKYKAVAGVIGIQGKVQVPGDQDALIRKSVSPQILVNRSPEIGRGNIQSIMSEKGE